MDVVGRPIANEERINGASLKAAGSLLLWTRLNYSFHRRLLQLGKIKAVKWSEWKGISICIAVESHRVLTNLLLYSPLTRAWSHQPDSTETHPCILTHDVPPPTVHNTQQQVMIQKLAVNHGRFILRRRDLWPAGHHNALLACIQF